MNKGAPNVEAAAKVANAELDPWMRSCAFAIANILVVLGLTFSMLIFYQNQDKGLSEVLIAFAILLIFLVGAAFSAMMGRFITWDQFDGFVRDVMKSFRNKDGKTP
jgi:ABC-type transport system involved in cytochrome bd biosynthesis fused ATPase/permease subunit